MPRTPSCYSRVVSGSGMLVPVFVGIAYRGGRVLGGINQVIAVKLIEVDYSGPDRVEDVYIFAMRGVVGLSSRSQFSFDSPSISVAESSTTSATPPGSAGKMRASLLLLSASAQHWAGCVSDIASRDRCNHALRTIEIIADGCMAGS